MTSFLRTLRSLDRNTQAAKKRLSELRALGDSLTDPPDLSDLEAAAEAAEAAYRAHAALNPELAAEYETRAELAEVRADIQRAHRTLATLRAARAAVIPEPPPPPSDAHVTQALRAASEADAAYQAALAAGSWHAIHAVEAKAQAAGRAARRAEAEHAARMHRHRLSVERHAALQARERRHAADIALTMQSLALLTARAEALTQALPPEPAAPLREPRRPFNAPVTDPETRAAIRERYRYEPATGTLHRLPHGELVRAPQSLTVNGRRIPRAAVLEVLAPPAPDLDAINPESLA